MDAGWCHLQGALCFFSFKKAAFLHHLKIIILMTKQYNFMLIYYNLLVFPLIISFS